MPSDEEQRELDKLFGPWGDRIWCGLPLHKLVDAIEEEWDQPEDLRRFFAIAHATNNEIHHTSARSLLSAIGKAETATYRVDSAPSVIGVEIALHSAVWSYAHLLRAVATHFEIEGGEEIEPLRMRCEAQFVPIKALNVERNPGRNDPCPCGSGKKFKRCHGV